MRQLYPKTNTTAIRGIKSYHKLSDGCRGLQTIDSHHYRYHRFNSEYIKSNAIQ